MSTSGKLQQHHHPVLGIQVMTRVPFSSACNWGGGPLTEWVHEASVEGSLGVVGG